MPAFDAPARDMATVARFRRWRLDRPTAFGLAISVVVLFAVPGGMLWLIGYNYDGLTGSAATKIHPFTYMIVLIFVWRTIASGNGV